MTAVAAAGAGRGGLKPVGFMEAWKRGWTFSAKGRASRGEYWWRMLGVLLEGLLVALVLFVVHGIWFEWKFWRTPDAFWIVSCVLYALWLLPLGIALLLLRIRRLHDQGLSGWFVLLWNAPPVMGLIFTLRPGTRGPNQFGPVPGIRPDELQAVEGKSALPGTRDPNQFGSVPSIQPDKLQVAKVQSALLRLWDKAGEAEFRFDQNIRKVFLILAGCFAAIGFFPFRCVSFPLPGVLGYFRTVVPFVGFLLLALPGKSTGRIKTGMVLEAVSALLLVFLFLAAFGAFGASWTFVWLVGFVAFLWIHLFQRQGAKKICAWVLAGWCLVWCFTFGYASFLERVFMFVEGAMWGLIALKEGRPGLGPDSQEPEERQVG